MRKIILFVFFTLTNHLVFGQANNLYKEGQLSHDGDTLKYRYLLPENFDEKQKYPVVLFLHGAGERGDDNEKQLVHGSKLFLDSINKYPSVVIFPQCASDSYWAVINVSTDKEGKRNFSFPSEGEPTKAMKLVLYLLDSVIQQDFIDKNRIYLTGLSMGGMGTFELVARRPEVFAAAIPICGGGNPELVKNYNPKTAFWVFHGGKDDVVPPINSTIMVKALQQHDFTVRYTLFHDANHNSWDPAFQDPEFLSWLFSQNLNKN